jgi:cyanophycin synthetase
LRDPTVEFAVLETARGGILRSGLGFSICDIGIITNIQEDHLGISDIHSLEDLAKVKATVVKKKDGWAILNGDDAHCIRLGAELNCNVAYFSLDEESPFIKKLSAEGKIVAVYENGFITIKKENGRSG